MKHFKVQIILTILSLIFACISIFFAWQANSINEKANQIQFRPYIGIGNTTVKINSDFLSIFIEYLNTGIVPAINVRQKVFTTIDSRKREIESRYSDSKEGLILIGNSEVKSIQHIRLQDYPDDILTNSNHKWNIELEVTYENTSHPYRQNFILKCLMTYDYILSRFSGCRTNIYK